MELLSLFEQEVEPRLVSLSEMSSYIGPIAIHEYPNSQVESIDFIDDSLKKVILFGLGPVKITLGSYTSFVNDAVSWVNIRINYDQYSLFEGRLGEICSRLNLEFLQLGLTHDPQGGNSGAGRSYIR